MSVKQRKLVEEKERLGSGAKTMGLGVEPPKETALYRKRQKG